MKKRILCLMLACLLLLVGSAGCVKTQPGNETQTKTDTISETETGSKSDTDSDTETESKSDTDSDTNSETGIDDGTETLTAVYRGLTGYGTITKEQVQNPAFQGFLFENDGEVKSYTILSENGHFELQNRLMEGETYRIVVKTGQIVDLALVGTMKSEFSPVVEATPGERTLKNFIATAMSGLGTALYVFGGNWNFLDDGASPHARTIGIPRKWLEFFASKDVNYNYCYVPGTGNQTPQNPAESIYPFAGFNAYWYQGVDCTGYVGWVIYNTLNTEDDRPGYVHHSTELCKWLSEEQHLGTYTREKVIGNEAKNGLKTGDIFSMDGHAYIVIGACADGSVIIAHSSPTPSRTGEKGGGIQLSALNPAGDENKNCEAYRLAKAYTEKFYPEWSARYEVIMRPYSGYALIQPSGANGKFTWDLTGEVLTDPDDYRNKTAKEILVDLYGE